jgi:hypothetical protein
VLFNIYHFVYEICNFTDSFFIRNRGRKKYIDRFYMKTTQNSAKYNKTRVCIGDEYDRWTELKDVLRINLFIAVITRCSANFMRKRFPEWVQCQVVWILGGSTLISFLDGRKSNSDVFPSFYKCRLFTYDIMKKFNCNISLWFLKSKFRSSFYDSITGNKHYNRLKQVTTIQFICPLDHEWYCIGIFLSKLIVKNKYVYI